MTTDTKSKGLQVIPFYILAFAVSALFNSGLLTPLYQKASEGMIVNDWLFLPVGAGTLIAALMAFRFDRKLTRTITLLGNNKAKNILISVIPLTVFTVIGIENHDHLNRSYYAFVFSVTALLYAVSEEIFWRSYLVERLRPIGKFASGLIIGLLWWAWHMRFATTFDFTWFLLICVGSSFLLCQFADETKSYLTSAGMHSLIILATSGSGMNRSVVAGLVVSVAAWLIIGILWKNNQVASE